MVRSLRHLSLVATGVLLTVTMGAAPAAATGHPTTRPDAAAGWLARQMVDGERFEVDFGGMIFPDQGLTIDAIFAFAAAKTANDYGSRALTWLARPEILSGYTGDGVTESYSGSTAKLALAVQVRGGNPASFGGQDLLARLRALLTPSGRFSDRSEFGDFSNMFGQSLAIIALERTAAGAPESAVSFVVASRCADGGFPVFLGEATCTSDTDATALAVQALIATGNRAQAAPAVQWLLSVQGPDGSFSALGTPNANSTGVAGQALREALRLAAAAKARQFVLSLQSGCSAPSAQRGAIAFDATGFDPATAARATAQGILGLTGPGLRHLTSAGSSSGAPSLTC
ncbi:hypothetical protein Rhe02_16420 [Rhizocola hellebori]|uniref:Peptidase n=1 Tax=Rhizocola hellebori TaxID=1392758 RepID=A0A8J3Q5H6_9ACTN|nr:prenyltransferase/squalene oxidase repeat-containing protein [Rhizocola hellebori]GIH03575.1 hypothetical protein Rhe02_16420 [Rhizocola hellebori]